MIPDTTLPIHPEGSYKVWTGIITQADENNPTATVLNNKLGGDIVWTRQSVGLYRGTLTGAFTANKTTITANNGTSQNILWGYAPNTNWVNLFAEDDSILGLATVEIRVYN